MATNDNLPMVVRLQSQPHHCVVDWLECVHYHLPPHIACRIERDYPKLGRLRLGGDLELSSIERGQVFFTIDTCFPVGLSEFFWHLLTRRDPMFIEVFAAWRQHWLRE